MARLARVRASDRRIWPAAAFAAVALSGERWRLGGTRDSLYHSAAKPNIFRLPAVRRISRLPPASLAGSVHSLTTFRRKKRGAAFRGLSPIFAPIFAHNKTPNFSVEPGARKLADCPQKRTFLSCSGKQLDAKTNVIAVACPFAEPSIDPLPDSATLRPCPLANAL